MNIYGYPLSLPLRECGLKYTSYIDHKGGIAVTPFAGVWIEIDYENFINHFYTVTPFAGVWIEIITIKFVLSVAALSLPLRECGLKCTHPPH